MALGDHEFVKNHRTTATVLLALLQTATYSGIFTLGLWGVDSTIELSGNDGLFQDDSQIYKYGTGTAVGFITTLYALLALTSTDKELRKLIRSSND